MLLEEREEEPAEQVKRNIEMDTETVFKYPYKAWAWKYEEEKNNKNFENKTLKNLLSGVYRVVLHNKTWLSICRQFSAADSVYSRS